MMKQTFAITVLVSALAVFSMASCVKEEMEECLDVRLLIKTDHDTGRWGNSSRTRSSDIDDWYDDIESITVYVFDENEKYVTHWEGPAYISGMDYEVPLREIGLPEGVYTFVAWTNRGDEYACNVYELLGEEPEPKPEPETRQEEDEEKEPNGDFYLKDMLMYIKNLPENGGALKKDLSHRHHGILPRAYVSNNSILYPKPATIELSPSLHNVNFSVTGLAPEVIGDGYSMTVHDSNSSHDFYNKHVSKHGVPYKHVRTLTAPVVAEPEKPETRADEVTKLITSMHLMQLDDATTTKFELHNATTGHLIHDGNLVELIQTVYWANDQPLNFDEILEFDVEITFITRTRIALVINGWQYILTVVPPLGS